MAEQNPKIQKWLDIGKRRFAENGAAGIHINEMSDIHFQSPQVRNRGGQNQLLFLF